jgi:DNA-binding response OmpR family regulator
MRRKVLVVDDEPSIVVPLTFLMEKSGYAVQVAGTADEALAAVADFAPDLILLDIMLPGVDGFEICQAVRDNPSCRSIKIVFITAMGRDVDVARGMASGADAYITKPFANAEVLETVKRLLE